MKLLFLGSADFAVPSLKALLAAGHQVALVVCQPDRPKGRGHQLQAPPLKRAALELGLEVFQPEKIKDEAALQRLEALKADAGCVVAYGQILPQRLLDAPRLGCLNVHASLLPRWRGAAPIEWALAKGDTRTGVCVQRMVYKLDAGEVLLSSALELGPADDAPALHPKLAVIGAGLLVQALQGLQDGSLQGQPQDEALATYAPLLKKSDGALDFKAPAPQVQAVFRGFKARPGCTARLEGGGAFKVLGLSPGGRCTAAPGTLASVGERGLEAACGDGVSLWLEQVLPLNGKPMSGAEYARGRSLRPGQAFIPPF